METDLDTIIIETFTQHHNISHTYKPDTTTIILESLSPHGLIVTRITTTNTLHLKTQQYLYKQLAQPQETTIQLTDPHILTKLDTYARNSYHNNQ